MIQASPLTLTYDSFANFWKALVSRRKAKRLDIDKDEAWAQLHAEGVAAPFLRAEAARKDAKKVKRDGDRAKKPDNKRKGDDKTPKAKSSQPPKASAKSAKAASTKTVAKRRQNRGKTP